MKKDIRYRLLAVGEIVEDGDEEFVLAAGWCPVEAHCAGKKVEDDDMPVRRAFARRLRAADQQVMGLGKALEIVWEMAKSLYHQHGEFCKPAKCPADATTAMDTVEDFIVNHFEEDDEVQSQTRQERLSALFEAMERHGNAEGTETQLGDAEEFLRLAFENMSPTQQTEFLDSQAVSEFIEREGGEEEV
jgi:hypothetical protein